MGWFVSKLNSNPSQRAGGEPEILSECTFAAEWASKRWCPTPSHSQFIKYCSVVSCLNRWTVTLYLPLQHQFRLSKNKACWQTFPYYDMVSGMLKSYESVVVLFCWGTTCTWLITTWLTLAYLRTLTYITANLCLRGQRPMYPSSCPDHPQTQASNGAAVFECWWGCMNLHTGAFKSFSGLASKKTSNKHCISNFLSRKEP